MGWRLSPAASLLRAPYGANNIYDGRLFPALLDTEMRVIGQCLAILKWQILTCTHVMSQKVVIQVQSELSFSF